MNEKEYILIVDDDESTRRLFSLTLQKKGYGTETAATGKEALQKAQKRRAADGSRDGRPHLGEALAKGLKRGKAASVRGGQLGHGSFLLCPVSKRQRRVSPLGR